MQRLQFVLVCEAMGLQSEPPYPSASASHPRCTRTKHRAWDASASIPLYPSHCLRTSLPTMCNLQRQKTLSVSRIQAPTDICEVGYAGPPAAPALGNCVRTGNRNRELPKRITTRGGSTRKSRSAGTSRDDVQVGSFLSRDANESDPLQDLSSN
jgi:hypothetical protein